MWWSRAIREAESLGAKVELANTWLEMANRLSEPASPFRELGGHSAASCRDKADTLFREMEIAIP